MQFRYRNPKEILYLLGGFCNRSPPKYSFCYGISLQEPKRNLVLTRGSSDRSSPKYWILLWDFRSPREILYILVDFMTGAHLNTDFAMGFRFRSPKEILYLLRRILEQQLTEILILLWNFATQAQET